MANSPPAIVGLLHSGKMIVIIKVWNKYKITDKLYLLHPLNTNVGYLRTDAALESSFDAQILQIVLLPIPD